MFYFQAQTSKIEIFAKQFQELFETISDICGLEGAVPQHRNFMVTEVFGRGQDAHVDHTNIDDVAAGQPIDFLDLTRQSPSRSNQRRVVPTLSIVLYFNAVGGIRFPYADGMNTIAGKRGRMIIFENYQDECRPSHQKSAEHYGIYFETLPKRLLVMGVLANKTPAMSQTAESTKGLIYCAGTERDPLFHDNPSYDCYRRRPRRPEPEPVKEDLIVSLEVSFNKKDCSVIGRSVGGEELCQVQCSKEETMAFLTIEIQGEVDPDNKRNVLLCSMDGQLLTAEHADQTLLECFKSVEEDNETSKTPKAVEEDDETSKTPKASKSLSHLCTGKGPSTARPSTAP